MRAIGLLAALFAAPAAAEPPAKLPEIVKELVIRSPAILGGEDAVGIDGTRASGLVIQPPTHADAQLAPRGALIIPPDPNDPMALELGTNWLRSHGREREPWLPRDLSRGFKRGADKIWDFVLPKL